MTKKDIIEFFTENKSLGLNSKLATRMWGIRGFFGRKLSLHDTFTFMLPGFPSRIPASAWEKLLADYINSDGTMNLFGKPFHVPYNNYGDFVVLVHQVIIDDQYHVKNLVTADATVIDGGANMGIFAVFVAHEKPNTTVYAFEPATDTFASLAKNVASYPNVHAFPQGLAEIKTEREFQAYEHSTVSNHFISEGFAQTGTTTKAALTSIDDFVTEHNVPRIDFIKMDTEGYEANILKGSVESIKKWKPSIVMSAYHRPEDKDELPKILLGIYPNYKCELRTDNEEDLVCVAD